MNVNFVHLHMLLNHVPTVGTIVALGVFLLALAWRNVDVKRTSFALFFAVALVALPTFMTGYSAQKAVRKHPGVSATVIDRHQSAALLALLFMEATGVAAWFGLWDDRQRSAPRGWSTPVVFLLSVVTIGLMANAAYIGGEISHPEIMSPGEVPGGTLAPAALITANISRFQFAHPWAWPTLETVHFIGLCLLFGVVLAGNLRILGFMKSAPFPDIRRLLPWAIWGFALNAVTGILFFAGAPGQYIENLAFHYKVLFMLLAGANVLYLTLLDKLWTLGPGDNAPVSAKLLAASQLFLWVGIIYFGRMLPYLGNGF
jgi:uncharacterized membrane protein